MSARLPLMAVLCGVSALSTTSTSGCAIEPGEPAAELGTITSAVVCSGFGCNDNSPIVAGAPFYELHRGGLANDQGLKVVGFRGRNGTKYQVDVRQARLVGLDVAGNVVLDTPDMTGAVLTVRDAAQQSWELTVLDVGMMAFWGQPGGGAATTYRIGVRGPNGEGAMRNLCSSPPAAADWPGGSVMDAMLFEGDRYRPIEKIVSATGAQATGWFNIACAGTATAKLHLMRHTETSSVTPTTRDERQALLRALTAAVCWGSDAFTFKGEDLNVYDRKSVMPPPIAGATIEGLWGPSGAICLGEQRLVQSDAASPADALAVRSRIAVQCPKVPSCAALAGFPANWKQLGMVLTTNP